MSKGTDRRLTPIELAYSHIARANNSQSDLSARIDAAAVLFGNGLGEALRRPFEDYSEHISEARYHFEQERKASDAAIAQADMTHRAELAELNVEIARLRGFLREAAQEHLVAMLRKRPPAMTRSGWWIRAHAAGAFAERTPF